MSCTEDDDTDCENSEDISSAVDGRFSKLECNVNRYAASLSIRNEEHRELINNLTQRVLLLEIEKKDTITIKPLPLSLTLRSVDEYFMSLTESEKDLDKLSWRVFDNQLALRIAGGYYNLNYLGEDIIDFNEDICSDFVIDLEDSTATALRWCRSRTKWFRNTRYWVQPASGCLIIKRNRFIFQVSAPPKEAMILE